MRWKAFVLVVGALIFLAWAAPSHAAQGAAAVQASGDITLSFGIQHEIDFEVRDNYDLDNGLSDGCIRASVIGNDCSGSAARVDGFVEQETRFIVQGSQGDIWKARVVMEAEDIWEPEQLATNQLERAWADIKLYDTPVHVKAGLWWDELDPFRLVYSDDDTGIKVYAIHGNISWAAWWIKEDETSDNADTTGGRDGDQDYYMARVTLDFGSFQVSPAIGVVRNRNTTNDGRFGTGLVSVDAFGSVCHNFRSADLINPGCLGPSNTNNGVTVDENVFYPGLIAKGNFGPVSFVGQVFGAFGEIGDDSAVDAQRNQDVSAFLVAADIGVKLGAWTPHAGLIYASGDDNPHDDDAEAWAPISSDNENLLGERGIIMDDQVQVLGIADDSITMEGVNPVARGYSLQPGIIALFVGLKGRPTKKISTDLNLVYFQWDMEKQWEYVYGMVSTTLCTPDQTLSQQGVCSNPLMTNGVADGNGLISTVDDEMGWELNGQVTYDFNKHVRLTISAAVFWPGDGAEVVAQCINSLPFDNSFLIGAPGAVFGCGPVFGSVVFENGSVAPADNPGGSAVETVLGIDRANDEAFNLETELMVQF